MTDVRDAAISFEAVKTSLSQTKDGMILRLAIHPSDMPRQLMTDWVGSRYTVAMVKMGDDDQPEINPEKLKADRAVKSAGMLCRNEAFQAFMVDAGYAPTADSEAAVSGLRDVLGITSRSEMHDRPEVVTAFYELTNEFEAWRKQNPHKAKTERRNDEEDT